MKDSTKEQLDRIEKKLDNPLNQVWFSISDVTRLTGLSRSTINRYISNGQLKTVKSGERKFYTPIGGCNERIHIRSSD